MRKEEDGARLEESVSRMSQGERDAPEESQRKKEGETMIVGGLQFPYDRERDTTGHGPVASFVIRTHPLAMWIPAIIVGVIVGWYFQSPMGWSP